MELPITLCTCLPFTGKQCDLACLKFASLHPGGTAWLELEAEMPIPGWGVPELQTAKDGCNHERRSSSHVSPAPVFLPGTACCQRRGADQGDLLLTAVTLPSTAPGTDWKSSLSLFVCQCFKDGSYIHLLPVCQAGPSVSSHSHTPGWQ